MASDRRHYKWMHSGPYLEAKRICLEVNDYICHLCKHDGADTADYITPVSTKPDQDRADPYNKMPAHGVKGCPTCGKKCNPSRGNKPVPTPLNTSRDW